MRSWQYALIALGVLLWAIAVFLMVEGSILEERTTGIATLLGLIGLFVLNVVLFWTMLQKTRKPSKET